MNYAVRERAFSPEKESKLVTAELKSKFGLYGLELLDLMVNENAPSCKLNRTETRVWCSFFFFLISILSPQTCEPAFTLIYKVQMRIRLFLAMVTQNFSFFWEGICMER